MWTDLGVDEARRVLEVGIEGCLQLLFLHRIELTARGLFVQENLPWLELAGEVGIEPTTVRLTGERYYH